MTRAPFRRSLRVVAVSAAMILALPLVVPALAATTFSADFTPTGSNAWWVQAKVEANAPLTGVDARVNGGAWKALSLRSYGWATSMSAPEGSIVQFQAKASGGASDLSGCYRWTTRAPVACPGTSPTTNTTTTAPSTGNPTFTPKSGSEWWVQVRVSGSPTKVESRDTNGAWVPLTLRSWGDWAASYHVEKGHQVQYRATLPGGATSASCWYVHPGTTCASTSTAPAPKPSTNTTAPTTSGVLWRDSFTASPWTTPWKLTTSWGTSRADVTRESGAAVPTFMRITYPDGAIGSNSGAEWKGKPFAPRESVNLRYDVRFPTDFEFVRGGKLPGLYGGRGNSGGNIPDGTDGWSARLMWRTDGKGEVYAYLPTSDTWGSRIGTGSWNFTADNRWHSVEQQIVLNSPSSSNGEVKVWYDGKLVLHKTGLKFRTVSTLKIDGVFFSTFYGGNDGSWAPSKTTHADFANFAVSTGYIGR